MKLKGNKSNNTSMLNKDDKYRLSDDDFDKLFKEFDQIIKDSINEIKKSKYYSSVYKFALNYKNLDIEYNYGYSSISELKSALNQDKKINSDDVSYIIFTVLNYDYYEENSKMYNYLNDFMNGGNKGTKFFEELEKDMKQIADKINKKYEFFKVKIYTNSDDSSLGLERSLKISNISKNSK